MSDSTWLLTGENCHRATIIIIIVRPHAHAAVKNRTQLTARRRRGEVDSPERIVLKKYKNNTETSPIGQRIHGA